MRGRLLRLRSRRRNGLNAARIEDAPKGRRFSTKGPTPLGGGVSRCEYMVCDDRSCRPLSSPGQTPIATCPAVQALRRQRYVARAKAANTPIIGPKHSEKETPELIEN